MLDLEAQLPEGEGPLDHIFQVKSGSLKMQIKKQALLQAY
jgi:hypothetical protein